MHKVVTRLPEKIPEPRIKADVDLDTDSEEDIQSLLDLAVTQYKNNKRKGQVASSSKDHMRETNEMKGNVSKPPSPKNTNYCAREWLNGNGSSDVQDLIKYFITPREVQKNEKGKEKVPKKSLSDYEKQGAIPKQKVRDTLGSGIQMQNKVCDKKTSFPSDQANFSAGCSRRKSKSEGIRKNAPQTPNSDVILNFNCENENEKIYSKPFFYIVPEKPSQNCLFPRGSYYVIPKTPSGSTEETVIFHPESTAAVTRGSEDAELGTNAEIILRASDHSFLRSMNNLGKDVLQRTDTHLNIGPMEVREKTLVDNLKVSSTFCKIFEKAVISPEKTSEVSPHVSQVTEISSATSLKVNMEESPLSSSEESDYCVPDVEDLKEGQRIPNKKTVAGLYFYDEDHRNCINCDDYLDFKFQEQYEKMVRNLPEIRVSDLLEKCIEFRGNEEKVQAYIERIQCKTKRQSLVTDLQHIFPDADPSFLLEEIKKLQDDDNAVNILTDELLESHDYPKISRYVCEAKRKLWWTYVKNFDVKNYLLNVPRPQDFAGEAGNQNKADEKLIMAFLSSRYPTASVAHLNQNFNSNSRNITRTCAGFAALQVVRLSDSLFEYENFDEDFLKEVCYIDHREEIDSYLKTLNEKKEIETIQARFEGVFLFCPLCFDEELIASEAITCAEGDVFCKKCIRRYVETKISDATYKFACLTEGCDSFFTISTLEELLPTSILSVIMKKQQAEEISTAEVDDLEICPHCDFAYIPNPEDKIFRCQNPNCLEETCRICNEKNHIPLRCEEIERQVDVEARKKIEEMMTKTLIRKCPKCGMKFVKIDGCNMMQCVCGAKICYICNNEINDYGHFSDDGCSQYSKNEILHETAVLQAGVQAKDEILSQNPNVRILYDPTESLTKSKEEKTMKK